MKLLRIQVFLMFLMLSGVKRVRVCRKLTGESHQSANNESETFCALHRVGNLTTNESMLSEIARVNRCRCRFRQNLFIINSVTKKMFLINRRSFLKAFNSCLLLNSCNQNFQFGIFTGWNVSSSLKGSFIYSVLTRTYLNKSTNIFSSSSESRRSMTFVQFEMKIFFTKR